MRVYETPGVYFERTDASLPGVRALRTDIAGFVGIAERGPTNLPIPIESWRQFEAYFGRFTASGYLAYAVRAFFENGGGRCWVVRVASDATTTAQIQLQALIAPAINTAATWQRIEAISPGVWGNDLEITLQETHQAQTKTVPAKSQPNDVTVDNSAGFAPRILVRLSQDGLPPDFRVIDSVDADHSRLRLNDSITGFDLTRPVFVESIEYTIIIRVAGKLQRTYQGISLVPGHPRFGPDILPSLDELIKLRRRNVLPAAPEPISIRKPDPTNPIPKIYPLDLSVFRNLNGSAQAIGFRGGSDGLVALRTVDFTGEEVSTEDNDIIREQKERGITSLNTIDEIAIVAVPDIHIRPMPIPQVAPIPPCVPDECLPSSFQPPVAPLRRSTGDSPPTFSDEEVFAVQMYLVNQCEKLRDRFAILDPPCSAVKNSKLGTLAIRQWRSRFDSTFAALYYPWLKIVDPFRNPASLTREIPPSGHVAGVFARGDLEFGVHKAPANIEFVWAEDLTAQVSDAEQGLLNSLGINALRTFPGRGIRINGARTVSSDTDWRFINVRRLLLMIEESIDESLQWAVFEPNDHITRTRVTLAVRSFLVSLWQRGALMGPTENDAFFVRCNDTNNPASERDNGRLLAEVGVAASQPFEFVVLRVGRVNNAFEIAEAGVLAVKG